MSLLHYFMAQGLCLVSTVLLGMLGLLPFIHPYRLHFLTLVWLLQTWSVHSCPDRGQLYLPGGQFRESSKLLNESKYCR